MFEIWEAYVTDVQRIHSRQLMTILRLTKGDLQRPDRQLLVVDPFEELAARMIRGNLIAAVVTVMTPQSICPVGQCHHDLALLHGRLTEQPLRPTRIDLASLVVLA